MSTINNVINLNQLLQNVIQKNVLYRLRKEVYEKKEM